MVKENCMFDEKWALILACKFNSCVPEHFLFSLKKVFKAHSRINEICLWQWLYLFFVELITVFLKNLLRCKGIFTSTTWESIDYNTRPSLVCSKKRQVPNEEFRNCSKSLFFFFKKAEKSAPLCSVHQATEGKIRVASHAFGQKSGLKTVFNPRTSFPTILVLLPSFRFQLATCTVTASVKRSPSV